MMSIMAKNYKLSKLENGPSKACSNHYHHPTMVWRAAKVNRGAQRFLTRSRKIKLFESSESIFIYNTKYWTTKKICKIEPLGPKEKINFFSFFLMRKRLSSGQK